jgi:hypothetical protein
MWKQGLWTGKTDDAIWWFPCCAHPFSGAVLQKSENPSIPLTPSPTQCPAPVSCHPGQVCLVNEACKAQTLTLGRATVREDVGVGTITEPTPLLSAQLFCLKGASAGPGGRSHDNPRPLARPRPPRDAARAAAIVLCPGADPSLGQLVST